MQGEKNCDYAPIRSCVFDLSFVWNIGHVSLSNRKAKWAKI